MSEDTPDDTPEQRAKARATAREGAPKAESKPTKPPRIVRWRVALVMLGLGIIAVVSVAFGTLTAVSSDLPQLESREEYKHSANSVLVDVKGKPLGVLVGPMNRYLVPAAGISPAMKHAVIAIEDRRFYENAGIDLRGMGRALWTDITSGGAVQGASTITQQFVKNALEAADNRTLFQKLREAVLAYHLNRRWPKDKILSEYLNTIYYGQGAYGIESAARVYFGKAHPGCGQLASDRFCAADLDIAESAVLAGVIASPNAFDPVAHPMAAKRRRNIVLQAMHDQGYITDSEYEQSRARTLPDVTDITPPQEQSNAPYFSSWIRSLLVAKLGATRAFTGGLKIRTTIDMDMQQAAEQSVEALLPSGSGLPSASLVAIDNKTGGVRAMVGGPNFTKSPFNLATQGHRQPGSAFKPITLAVALQHGYSTGSTLESRKKIFTVPHTGGKEFFIVNNYENSYAGALTLTDAMIRSDNSVYAELGIKVGTKRIAQLANRMGIRSPVSTNYAVTLGGLREGVTPLDMAHAYETFATGGLRIDSGNGLGGTDGGPVGIETIRAPSGKILARNRTERIRVMPKAVAQSVSDVLSQVVSSGTGKQAALAGFAAGKTGTTENYGDAWFVGWNEKMTVAVWVGYPDRLRPMKTQFDGSPVAGGTFPAILWHNFMTSAMDILAQRVINKQNGQKGDAVSITAGSADANNYSGGSSSSTDSATSDQPQQSTDQTQGGGGNGDQTQNAPTTPTPAPSPDPQPSGGGSSDGGSAAGGSGPTG